MDKMFLMFPSFKTIRYDYPRAKKDFEKINNDEAVNKLLTNIGLDTDIETTPEEFKKWFKEHKEEYKLDIPILKKIKFNHDKSFMENSVEARNNLIIDIATGILTNKDTMTQLFNPVNFDPIKKEAKIAAIMSNQEIYNAWAKENNIAKNDIFKELKKLSEKEISKIISKYSTPRSLLNPTTFAYFHNQNATGGKNIGNYANTTTIQGKYQTTQLKLKPENSFMINGYEISSLHDIFTVRNGVKQYISKICDYFGAASVDNVKDPVLALIQQRPENTYITGFMARAGMTVEEISLMFSQPLVKERLNSEKNYYETKAEVLADTVDEMMEIFNLDLKKEENQKKYDEIKAQIYEVIKQNRINITSNVMAENIINGNLTDLDIESISQQDLINIIGKQLAVFSRWLDVEEYAAALARTTSFSRADTPNGAIDITLAGANMQVYKVSKYLKDVKNNKTPFVGDDVLLIQNASYETTDKEKLFQDLMNEKIPMKRLQAMYTLGIEKAVKAYDKYFLSQNFDVQKLTQNLYLNNRKFREKQMNELYLGIVSYQLSKTKLFGTESTDTNYKTKRDYYLYEFPIKLIELIKENSNQLTNPILKHLSIKNGYVQLERSGRINPELRENFEYLFENLWYGTDFEKQLAKDLFMYSYYKEGFNFGPNSFGAFFNTNYILHFPEVVKILQNPNLSPYELALVEKFYFLQHPEMVQDFARAITNDNGETVYTSVFSGKYVRHIQDKENKTDTIPTGWYELSQTYRSGTGEKMNQYKRIPGIFNNGVTIWDVNGDGKYADEAKEKEKYNKIAKITTYSLNKLNERDTKDNKETTIKDSEQASYTEDLAEDMLGILNGYDSNDTLDDADSIGNYVDNSVENSLPSDELLESLQNFIDKNKIESASDNLENAPKYDENKSQQIQIDNGGKPLCK